jgi:hypothetical protein
MDLGKTALGNWKAQQGGCTHIQVRATCAHIRLPVFAHFLKMEALLPPRPLVFQ